MTVQGVQYFNNPITVTYRLKGFEEEIKSHSHQHYEIFFFHQGNCRYLINHHIYDLQSGDILLMDGLALHKPNVPDDSDYIRSHIHFDPNYIAPILKSLGATPLLNVFHRLHHCLIRPTEKNRLEGLESLFKKMHEVQSEEGNAQQEEWILKILLTHVLIKVNRLGQIMSQKEVPAHNDKAQRAEKIISFIRANFQRKLSLELIANEVHLNPSYVSHVFKEMTGFAVMEYVMAVRLQQVKLLLEMETNKTLQQIAKECGFESAAHFTRFFKANEGITPKQYRENQWQIEKRSE